MGFSFLSDPEVTERDDRFFVDMFVDEPRALIGERGANLRSVQFIVRLTAARKYNPDIKIDIDVNGYKKKREEFIREMAHRARRQALEGKRSVELEPMTAFDRRVIHTTLATFEDVTTESHGEGFGRHVTISLSAF